MRGHVAPRTWERSVSCGRGLRFSGPVFRRKPGCLLGAPPPSQQEMFPDPTPAVPQYVPHNAIAAPCSTRTFPTHPLNGGTCVTYASRSMQSQSDSTPHSLRHEPTLEHSFDGFPRTPERCTRERFRIPTTCASARWLRAGTPREFGRPATRENYHAVPGVEQVFENTQIPAHRTAPQSTRRTARNQQEQVTHEPYMERTRCKARNGTTRKAST